MRQESPGFSHGECQAFDCFFNETMDHINDGRYHAVWAIFDEMVHDPGNVEAGKAEYGKNSYGEYICNADQQRANPVRALLRLSAPRRQ